ncbi:MAG TPA: hypothetical protein VE621_19870 [Bryobacteraceae bacterium]|nr:hypothetical protein [Bryobacteraceae bacterium]
MNANKRAPYCVALALAAVLCVLLWQTLTVRFNYGGNWTALFCTGGVQRLPPDLAAGTYLFPGSHGYDGQFYRYMAHDPSPAGPYARYIDDARLRYRRILLPAAAHATGYPDAALIGLVVLFTGLGVYWTARYFAIHGKPVWWGLLFLVAPATLASFDRTLLDGPLLALFVGFLLYLEEERFLPLLLICVAAPLVRDTGAALPFAAAVHFAWRRQYWRALSAAACALPAVAWWLVVDRSTPPSGAHSIFSWPVIGIVQRLFVLRTAQDALTQNLLRVTDVVALLGLLVALVMGVREVPRIPTVGGRVAVGCFIVLAALLTAPSHLVDPYGFSRPVSPLLMALAMLVVLGRPIVNAFPFAAMSLAVGLYFVRPALGIVRGIAAEIIGK